MDNASYHYNEYFIKLSVTLFLYIFDIWFPKLPVICVLLTLKVTSCYMSGLHGLLLSWNACCSLLVAVAYSFMISLFMKQYLLSCLLIMFTYLQNSQGDNVTSFYWSNTQIH